MQLLATCRAYEAISQRLGDNQNHDRPSQHAAEKQVEGYRDKKSFHDCLLELAFENANSRERNLRTEPLHGPYSLI